MHQMGVAGPVRRQVSFLALFAWLVTIVLVPGSVVGAVAPGTVAFETTWSRTDKPVADKLAVRTWMWGPSAHTLSFREHYKESPGGERLVQYFDKSRMEISNPQGDQTSLWYVTNGLLVVEMVTGELQLGEQLFETRAPAQVNVAGDSDDPSGPTYATFGALRHAPALADGALITQRVDRAGKVTNDPGLAQHHITAARRVRAPKVDHQVASPFWNFMNGAGLVFDGGRTTQALLFQDPFYATGFPISEAYWASVKVDGIYRDVLMQCFERRCLTFTPGHAPEWQVEAGNVGLHYFSWRYGSDWQPSSPLPQASDGRAMLLGVSGNAFPWEPDFGTSIDLLRESNVGRARLEFRWSLTEPARGAPMEFSEYDTLVAEYKRAGLEPFGLLGYSVAWASGGNAGDGSIVFGPPTDLDAWENYVYQTVRRYKADVHAWEIWNEPDVAMFWNGRDGGDPVLYTELLKRAYQAVKRADPQAIVVSAGVTGTSRGAAFIQTMLDHGAADSMDALGIHGYISGDGFSHTIYPDIIWPQVSAARARSGKPLWVTEVGWSTSCTGSLPSCGERQQAINIVKNVVMLFSLGQVEMVSVFQFKDAAVNPLSMGLVQNGGVKRESYTAMQTLADRLTGLEYVGKIDRGAGVWALRFTGPDRTLEVVWSTEGDRRATIDGQGYANAFVYQLDGSFQHQPAAGGSIDMLLSSTPLLVEFGN